MPSMVQLAAALVLLTMTTAVGAADPQPVDPFPKPTLSPSARCALANSIVSMQANPEPHFVLRYRGPVSVWRGPLCYHFAGYNPTCRALAESWLTPATPLTFPAPGQVPFDLLEGYRLLLSAPQQFPEHLRFDQPVSGGSGWTATAPSSWRCPLSTKPAQ